MPLAAGIGTSRAGRRQRAPAERDNGAPSPTLRDAYGRRQARLRAFFLRRTGSPEAAEDLVQELWLRIARDADATGFENPDSWLQRIAINLALNWLRQNRFQAQYIAHADDGADAVDDAPGPDRQAQARQGMDFLRDLLDELSPRRRRAFLLYRGEGLSLNETAQQMGVSSSTAKKQIAAAVAFLRERMSEAGLWP
ncbi:MAG: RNA polymerase sigma factor [Candidatus Andeanibacterium colombiense]|uniref:RNA polymerase sigma factor n=1 Tax=Candidatus Andeanibacterium colombiense TaxID=3121345 RepID=A0AAJ5X3Z0_9SPHN|nr:MAG: RNA polymerase sigma factor [Sphingomonadaceae bacterium]